MSAEAIVPAAAADVPHIRALVDVAYGKWVPLIGRKPAPMLAKYDALVTAGKVWVLRDDGTIAGVLVLHSEPDHLLIENVCVVPERQGEGIGTRLLAFAEAQAHRRGYGDVRLYTNVKFAENIAYYRRHGYEETHRGGQDGFERVYMRKHLT